MATRRPDAQRLEFRPLRERHSGSEPIWSGWGVIAGLGLTLVLHAAFIGCNLAFLEMASPATPGLDGLWVMLPTFVLGITQLFYMLPAIRWARLRQRQNLANGLAAGTVITAAGNVLALSLVQL